MSGVGWIVFIKIGCCFSQSVLCVLCATIKKYETTDRSKRNTTAAAMRADVSSFSRKGALWRTGESDAPMTDVPEIADLFRSSSVSVGPNFQPFYSHPRT